MIHVHKPKHPDSTETEGVETLKGVEYAPILEAHDIASLEAALDGPSDAYALKIRHRWFLVERLP